MLFDHAKKMARILQNWSGLKRFGLFTVAALLLSFLSWAILFLEYGVLNFGDSDMPPYQPDTPFEKSLDVVWFAITIGAGLLWLFTVIYATALLYSAFRRRMA